jgi:hypothetical protein
VSFDSPVGLPFVVVCFLVNESKIVSDDLGLLQHAFTAYVQQWQLMVWKSDKLNNSNNNVGVPELPRVGYAHRSALGIFLHEPQQPFA